MNLLCRLLGHRGEPHYSAMPRRTRIGTRCTRCGRVVFDARKDEK